MGIEMVVRSGPVARKEIIVKNALTKGGPAGRVHPQLQAPGGSGLRQTIRHQRPSPSPTRGNLSATIAAAPNRPSVTIDRSGRWIQGFVTGTCGDLNRFGFQIELQ